MALALAGEKKLQPQAMSVTLTRSRERRNKRIEVCDQVLACISRVSVLSLERGGPAPTATPSPWAPKMLLDPGFCPLRWMGAVSLSFPVPFKLFATLSKQLHPRAWYCFLYLRGHSAQWQQHSFVLDFRTWAKFHTVMGLSWECAYLTEGHAGSLPRGLGLFSWGPQLFGWCPCSLRRVICFTQILMLTISQKWFHSNI